MQAQNIDLVYEQQIKLLPLAAQLRLVELIVQHAARSALPQDLPLHSVMELHGLGAEIWEGVDAQEYVNKLRD